MIYTIGDQRVLITESLKKRVKESNLSANHELYEQLSDLYRHDPNAFRETILKFNLIGEEAQNYVVELLSDYVSGGRGQLKADEDLKNVYWLDIWINGQLLIRTLKLSDYVRIKIDLDEVTRLSGSVEDFSIVFKNGNGLRLNDNIMMT